VVVVVLTLVAVVLIVVLVISRGFVMRPTNETIKKSGHSGFQFGGSVSPSGLKGLPHGSRRCFLSVSNYVLDGSHISLRRSQRAHGMMAPQRDRFLKPI
jgi:hypothetical protein